MSEIKRVPTPTNNTMTILEQGDEPPRSSSSSSSRSVSRPQKKTLSEGLISLSPEPGAVKFEVEGEPRPGSGGSRSGSARRIEKNVQLFKKKEDVHEEPRKQCTENRTQLPENPLVKKVKALNLNKDVSIYAKVVPEEKPKTTDNSNENSQSESSESESDSDKSESEEKKKVPNNESKVHAPLELKAEFLKCIMDDDFENAKEICQKILLLEPDNATCIEFGALIEQKIGHDMLDEDTSEDDSEESDDDTCSDDEDNDDEEDSDSTSSSSDEEDDDSDSEEEFVPSKGLNLLMGGLPINPQQN